MKKFLSVLTILSLFTFTSFAQNNTIAFGLDAVVMSDGYGESISGVAPGLTFESALGKRFSLHFKGSYLRDNLLKTEDVSFRVNAKSFETGINFYFKKSQKGFFIGSNLAYSTVDYVVKSGDSSNSIVASPTSYVGAGTQLGFKTAISNRLTLATVLGTKVMVDTDGEDGLVNFSFGAKVGYKF